MLEFLVVLDGVQVDLLPAPEYKCYVLDSSLAKAASAYVHHCLVRRSQICGHEFLGRLADTDRGLVESGMILVLGEGSTKLAIAGSTKQSRHVDRTK